MSKGMAVNPITMRSVSERVLIFANPLAGRGKGKAIAQRLSDRLGRDGLDAKIVHELDRLRSGPIDLTSYALPAALALGFYTYPALTVWVDGKKLCRELPAVAFVGNVKEYGTGFPILPYARPDDGLLDVCVLPCANRADAIRQFLRASTGDHVRGEGAIYRTGKRVRVMSGEPVPVQIDGEAAGHTPLQCEL